ncbi:CopG family transcriptional regulator [Pyrococcus kukulkanii]|uniref:CopG family transcriptional regulator n=1 Tax=Pyrococcus kukulkanii TaxID=1609559 RepID=A0ABV4T696_9EURY
MSNEKGKIPKLFSGSLDELTKPGKKKKEERDLKKEKKQKTLYISLDANRKLIELYAEEGRRQSKIVEDAVDLYYYLKKALGERKFDELMEVVKREDPNFLRDYLEKLKS